MAASSQNALASFVQQFGFEFFDQCWEDKLVERKINDLITYVVPFLYKFTEFVALEKLLYLAS